MACIALLQRGGGVLGGAGWEGLTPAAEKIKEGALGYGLGLFSNQVQNRKLVLIRPPSCWKLLPLGVSAPSGRLR